MNIPKRISLSLAAAALISACSVNEHGFVDVERHEGDGAVVYRMVASGLHLNTRFDEMSLTLGEREGIYVFSAACDPLTGAPAARLAAASARARPEARIVYTAGLSLIGGAGLLDLSLGVREKSLILSRDSEANFARRLEFIRNDLGATLLDIVADGEKCVGSG